MKLIFISCLSAILFIGVLHSCQKKKEETVTPAPAAATCTDGIQNQNETGVDCGGSCTACSSIVPTCKDGIQNQNETGVDCGGPCTACSVGPTCNDGIQNQSETGIDCGGPCKACAVVVVCSPTDNVITFEKFAHSNMNINYITAKVGDEGYAITANSPTGDVYLTFTEEPTVDAVYYFSDDPSPDEGEVAMTLTASGGDFIGVPPPSSGPTGNQKLYVHILPNGKKEITFCTVIGESLALFTPDVTLSGRIVY